jgi:transketolase
LHGESARLKRIAYEIRKDIVLMTHAAQSGHPGGSLSAIDIVTCLFFHEMRLDPRKPDWGDRDRFVLSKGHACEALYGALCRLGYFPHEELLTFRRLGSRLQGHPERALLPGLDFTTGSLGQGLSAAHGMALGLRLAGNPARVYCMVGDGELQEGQIWEALLSVGHRKPSNLCVFLDRNRLQIDGWVEEIKHEEPLFEKIRDFGWHVRRIDGHDFGAILGVLEEARQMKDDATFVIAETVKGKGVSFMENSVKFHGVAPDDGELAAALGELDAELARMEAAP